MDTFFRFSRKWSIDWLLFGATIPLVAAGLLTMNSFQADNYFFERQLIWFLVSLFFFFLFARLDWHFLRQSGVVTTIYLSSIFLLLVLLSFGQVVRGAQGWLSFGFFAIDPAAIAALALVIILAKYFSRRHIEIANVRHIVISSIYALIPFILILIQPNFGSALIVGLIWLGMIMVSGINKRHLFLVIGIALLSFAFLWLFVFRPYQKERIVSFLHPLADIQGAGYNAFQSTVAVGSGQLVGKGVGYGTQSRLAFLPEYQTDFIFAAFAEEWGLVGVIILFSLFGLIIWRLIANATRGATNFEILFTIGVAIIIGCHFLVHIGMNIGLLPVTGLPLPFLSYGGTQLLVTYVSLGMVMGMRRYGLAYHRGDVHNEFIGPQ